jgi:hypothetical protein
MKTEKQMRPRYAPLSAGAARGRAADRIRKAVERTPAATVTEAMKRLAPQHQRYVMKRAEGMARDQAYRETITDTGRANDYGRRLEQQPHIAAALEKAEEAVIQGSLMSAAQRRDYVLDRLVSETQQGGDSARVRALELLGKTAGLFVDRSEVNLNSTGDIRGQIESLLNSVRGRTATHDVEDAQVIDAVEDSGMGDESFKQSDETPLDGYRTTID